MNTPKPAAAGDTLPRAPAVAVATVVLLAALCGCGEPDRARDSVPDGAGPPSPVAGARQAPGDPAGTTDTAGANARGPGKERLSEMRARMENRPVPVAVATVQRGRVDAFYASTTTLTAEEEAVVVAKTTGIVETILVEEGDSVTAGQELAQLDTRRLELEVARTRTNIESFERAYSRARQLFETKMISPDAYDQARYNLEREQANLALQLYELREATIRAPIDGVVAVRHIKLGNTLSPNTPAFEIKRALTVEAILNVPEKEMQKIARGQPALVRIDALGGRQFEGTVDRVAPQVDAQSGTFRVTVKVDNQDHVLKPGMFARVDIRYDTVPDTLLVARDAVVTDHDENTVFVVRDGLAMRQPVELGYTMGGEVEVTSGLAEGDQVVVTGQGGLRDGASVRIVSL